MNKTDKYISQPLAKKIHDKAKEKGFELPESEYYWYRYFEDEDFELFSKKDIINTLVEKKETYPAYDISELGEMLPRMIKIDDKKVKNKHKKIIGIFKLHFYKNDYEWLLQYKEWHGDKGLIITDAKTEAEARGQMYFYLLDNDLL